MDHGMESLVTQMEMSLSCILYYNNIFSIISNSNLSNNMLIGTIPFSIGNLKSLTFLCETFKNDMKKLKKLLGL